MTPPTPSDELRECLTKYIQHADGFGCYTVEEEELPKLEAALEAVVNSEIRTALDRIITKIKEGGYEASYELSVVETERKRYE
jgi:hypothetical protein